MEFDEAIARHLSGNAPNLIVFSDTHIGCRFGLCPPTGAALDGGSRYMPSKLQLVTWDWWLEFWDDWIPQVCRGEPFDLVLNGDALEGNHHRSVTQISHNLQDQFRLAADTLAPFVSRARKYYHIRGTEAHVGQSGQDEEKLARELGAVPNDEGQYARFDLWKRVGNADGPLCHILHHISTSGRAAYESSAPQAELIAEFAEAGQSGEVPPDYAIQSHRHRFIKVQNPSAERSEKADIVTPGWQLKTPYVYKIAGGRTAQPQMGGILIRQGDEEFYSRAFLRLLSRPRIEEN
jgi:hypothetical protein